MSQCFIAETFIFVPDIGNVWKATHDMVAVSCVQYMDIP